MLTEQACAKINLGLKVLGKRVDGYHAVDMIMQSVGLYDTLEFYSAPEVQLRIKNSPQLAADEQENLIVKAAKVLKDYSGYPGGALIVLNKRIPLEAGLAGGSADAAATLRGLNRLWNTGLSSETLEELAAVIGSDVAFCVRGGTQRATGRGEIVQPLSANPNLQLVIFKPDFGVSTAQVYKSFDLNKCGFRVDIDTLCSALERDNLPAIIAAMGNELESVTLTMYPLIAEIKLRMLTLGANYALMSGSGPSVFAIVPDVDCGENILAALNKEYRGVGCVTQSLNHG